MSASPWARHCVGRYSFELPADFSLSVESDLDLIFGRGIDFRKTTLRARRFEGADGDGAVAQELLTWLSKRPHATSATGTMLAERSKPDPRSTLVEAYAVRGRLDFLKLDLFRQEGPWVIDFSTSVSDEEDRSKVRADLLRTAASTRQVSQGTAQANTGCFATLQVDAKQDGEVYSLTFASSQMRDVVLSLSMNTIVAEPQESLLTRWDKKSGLLASIGSADATTFRRGEILLGGRRAEQLLILGRDRGRKVRRFAAETLLTSPSTPIAPLIALNLSMGGQVGDLDSVDASMTDAEAVAFWESLVRSFRTRS